MTSFLHHLLSVSLEAAPWLLLGLLAAGLIKAWVPDSLTQRWLGGSGLWPVAKAAVIGAPLPLCSCGVLPAALGLRRAGASRSATIAFLIATPETGVDSISVSYALLGPFMTVVRPLAAILSALFAGVLTLAFGERDEHPPTPGPAACSSPCCANAGCGATPPAPRSKTLDGLRYAVSDIWDDIVVWLVVGLLLAALTKTLVPEQALADWGSGLPAMLLMLLAGIPLYICATASTPVAAGLLLAGLSPGTVLVFLLAGPATNIATLAVVARELGRRSALAYLTGIAVGSVSLGLLTDLLVERWSIDIMAEMHVGDEFVPEAVAVISLLVLVVFAIRPLRRTLLGR